MFFICSSFLAIIELALFLSSIFYNSFVLGSSNHFSYSEPILFFKDSFAVDISTISSSIKSEVFLIAGTKETIFLLFWLVMLKIVG